MSIKSIGTALFGFLEKYAAEANANAEALSLIVGHLPIQAQDRARLKEYIAKLSNAAVNIPKALETLDLGGDTAVKINKADIDKAVNAYLSSGEGQSRIAAEIDAAVERATAPGSREGAPGDHADPNRASGAGVTEQGGAA